MAAVWIDGFVNEKQQVYSKCLFTIAAMCRQIKTNGGAKDRDRVGEREQNNTGTFITVLPRRECKVVTANASNNLFLRLLYKLVISIHLNINWIKI